MKEDPTKEYISKYTKIFMLALCYTCFVGASIGGRDQIYKEKIIAISMCFQCALSALNVISPSNLSQMSQHWHKVGLNFFLKP